MPQSYVRKYSDPYAFVEDVHRADVSLVLKGKGAFRGEIIQVEKSRLGIMRCDFEVAATIRSAPLTKRVSFSFPADPDQGSYGHGSLEMRPGDALTYGPGTANYFHISGPVRAAMVSLTEDDLASTALAITGRELVPPSDPKIIRPAAATMSRLMTFHAAVGQLAKASPDLLDNPAIVNAVEQELAHIVVRCLSDPMPAEARSDAARHARVIARFEDYLASRLDEPLYLAEICSAVGVAERTLRAYCQEYLGVGPVRYLWLRRMNLARRALLRADAQQTTVTHVATEYGFWELGRFSGEYRKLFGETPSATLKRPPEDGRP